MTDDEMVTIIMAAIERYTGNVEVLESAIGALAVGRVMGWRVVYFAHKRATINNFQQVLDVKFRDVLPERGPLARKSVALRIVDGAAKFWDVIKGRVSLPELKGNTQQII
jgi:hypothetical protein